MTKLYGFQPRPESQGGSDDKVERKRYIHPDITVVVSHMSDTAKTASQQRGRPFKKGASGNPRGRRAGSRNKATMLLEKMMADDGEGVVNAVLEAAKGGDMQAARIILDRICPSRKERPISCKLPKMEDTSDLVAGISAIMAAVANGELTPGEGQALASLIEAQRRTLETEDIDQRLKASKPSRV